MTLEEGLRLVVSFLGGGLIAGILNWIRANRAERIERAVLSLRDQVKFLYGPLHFFAAQNQSFLEVNRMFQRAYSEEYEQQQWSEDATTQHSLRADAESTIALANAHLALITRNNDQIYDVLREHFSHIDEDDIDVFRQFMVDYTRYNTETDDTGQLKTPLPIYRRVGDISFMRPEFITRVTAKFRTKRQQLAEYAHDTGGKWRPEIERPVLLDASARPEPTVGRPDALPAASMPDAAERAEMTFLKYMTGLVAVHAAVFALFQLMPQKNLDPTGIEYWSTLPLFASVICLTGIAKSWRRYNRVAAQAPVGRPHSRALRMLASVSPFWVGTVMAVGFSGYWLGILVLVPFRLAPQDKAFIPMCLAALSGLVCALSTWADDRDGP